MGDDLTVTSTTDSTAVIDAVATGDDNAARVPDASKFDGVTAAYEHPRSERRLLLERLKQHAADVEELSHPEDQPEQIVSTNESEGDPEAEVEPENIDMDAVRQAATEDAIAEARRRNQYYQEQQTQHFPQQAELDRMRSELAVPFTARLKEFPDIGKLFSEGMKNGPDIGLPVADALLSLPGGPEATVFLLQHPEERARLAAMPEHVQMAHVGQLTARLNPAAKRARSNAPAPIRPIGGSSTKSSLPLDEADYQTYRRARDAQDKTRYRR